MHTKTNRRNTPTCVGTTKRSCAPRCFAPEHPHVCGDNVEQNLHLVEIRRNTPTCVGTTIAHVSSRDYWLGTPPRVWGQHARFGLAGHNGRNTPTCVGTTQVRPEPQRCAQEHPHVCGDNASVATAISSHNGTPPRVWGQRRASLSGGGLATEHPHVCGDNDGPGPRCKGLCGTPPRVWGQL